MVLNWFSVNSMQVLHYHFKKEWKLKRLFRQKMLVSTSLFFIFYFKLKIILLQIMEFLKICFTKYVYYLFFTIKYVNFIII